MNYIDADAEAAAGAASAAGADASTAGADASTAGAASTGAATGASTAADASTGADASLLPQATKPRANKETSKSDFFMFILSIFRSKKILQLAMNNYR